MTALEIVRVRPGEELFPAWWEVYAASDRGELGDLAATWTLPELESSFAVERKALRQLALAGVADGEVVAMAWLELPQLDNLHRLECELHVRPDRRGRGHGSAMLAVVESLARTEGRSVIGAEINWPAAAGVAGGQAATAASPGVAFAWKRGFDLVLDDVRRDLLLPVAAPLLDELAREAAAHHGGYELRSWVGPLPEDLVAEWAALDASLDTEAPTGALDVEERVTDVAAVREREALVEAQARSSVHTVALAPDGRLAAYSEIVVPGHDPTRSYQDGTLVTRAHRGHRLGLAVKVANLRLLQARFPEVRRVITWNADSNTHMIAVNERLGFVVVGRSGEFQKRL